MAITKIMGRTQQYFGLSSDTKPTVSIDNGSVFYETDTGLSWAWSGSAWTKVYTNLLSLNPIDDTVSVQQAIGAGAHSNALESNHVLKNTAGKLTFLSFYNGNAAVRYLQLFDATSLPADTSIPAYVLASVPATTFMTPINFGVYGLDFTTGIVVASSSTLATLTKSASDAWFCAEVF